MSKTSSNIVGLCICLLFFGIGAYLLTQSVAITWNGKETTGRIVGIATSRGSKGSTMYAPEVEFTDPNGQVRRFTSRVSSSFRPSIGKNTSVLYDPADPDRAVVKNILVMYVLPGICIIAGLLMPFLFFVLPLIIRVHQKRTSERLRSIGRPVQAQIMRVAPTGVVVNGEPYYAITAQWLDTASNVMHVYKSFSMPYDPSQALQGKKEVTVYINPSNPKDYWMDTTFLPTLEA